ncbi:MAG: sigma-70 family RNA polymerase sigma factor [Acidobacteriota bacterium]
MSRVYTIDVARKVDRVTSEHELVKRARSGDSDAFCQLARLYERKVYWLALHYSRNPHDAEDLSQEVWLKAYKNLSGFRGEASFYTWLRQITINTFLNHKRSAMPEMEIIREDMGAAGDALSSFDLEDQVTSRLLAERVFQALGELTSQQRLIFLLKHREGMTYEEISTAIGCATGTVKKSLFRAVMKLREKLGAVREAAAGEGC